jgi:hypothetical protein
MRSLPQTKAEVSVELRPVGMHTMHHFKRNMYHDAHSEAASKTEKSVRDLRIIYI